MIEWGAVGRVLYRFGRCSVLRLELHMRFREFVDGLATLRIDVSDVGTHVKESAPQALVQSVATLPGSQTFSPARANER